MSQEPLLLTTRIKRTKYKCSLTLLLTAKERKQLRGKRTTSNGIEVLLHLPRGSKLLPGEILKGKTSTDLVSVKAADEKLFRIRANSKLALIKAAYHLGNRHVEIEINENELFLLEDLVMYKMLDRFNLSIDSVKRIFCPEDGAYD